VPQQSAPQLKLVKAEASHVLHGPKPKAQLTPVALEQMYSQGPEEEAIEGFSNFLQQDSSVSTAPLESTHRT